MTTSYDIELIRPILATAKAPVKAMDILTACQHLDPSTAHDVKNILQPDPHLIELVGEVRSFLESAASEGFVTKAGPDRWKLHESHKDSVPPLTKSPWTEGTWNEDKLERVVFLFPLVKQRPWEGTFLVQQLANFLGRKTRSVEAQLLMFRAIDSDDHQAWRNMNTLIPKIWERIHEIREHGLAGIRPDGMIDADYVPNISGERSDMPSDEPISHAPDLFLSWLSHGSRSVRRPFADASGRPLGKVIDTPLTRRLTQLAEDISTKRKSVRLIMLAGGPGNGKSDSIEVFLRAFVKSSANPENAILILETIFSQATSRTVDLEVGDLLPGIDLPFNLIRVIQDASEGSDSPESPGQLLIRDLKEVLDAESNVLVVCCVNRGILDEARLERSHDESDQDANNLIRECFNALRPAIPPISCWPLGDHDDKFVWPMDVESLCDTLDDTDEPCAVDQILESASTNRAWRNINNPETKTFCPFESNRQLLEMPTRRLALCQLLHDEEIAAGRRWTFRDIFGLVALLYTGGNARRDNRAPSSWSKDLQSSFQDTTKQKVHAILDLFRATYPQVLFPRWPSADHLKTAVEKLELDESGFTHSLIAYLSRKPQGNRYPIEELLAGSWSDRHDPANGCSSEWSIVLGKKDPVDVRQLEDDFSVSLHEGIQRCESVLTPLETKALEVLAKVEDEIDQIASDKTSKQAAATDCLGFVRRLGAIFAKRSLAVRDGQGLLRSDVAHFLDYLSDEETFYEESTESLPTVLGGDEQTYRIPLHATFGQPASYAVDGPTLSVKLPDFAPGEPMIHGPKAPPWRFREIKICIGDKTNTVDYTFELFLRLQASKDHLRPACLNRMLDGCLDRAKAQLDGQAVRLWGKNHIRPNSISLTDGAVERTPRDFRFTPQTTRQFDN